MKSILQKKSIAGSNNRANVDHMHSGGTKSFIQYLYEEVKILLI